MTHPKSQTFRVLFFVISIEIKVINKSKWLNNFRLLSIYIFLRKNIIFGKIIYKSNITVNSI